MKYKIKVTNHGQAWCQYDQFHRLDGPAIEYADSEKQWNRYGKEYRAEGPKFEIRNGNRFWYFKCKFNYVKSLFKKNFKIFFRFHKFHKV